MLSSEILLKLDPESAKSIHKNNRRRVLRAIAIYNSTGMKKSSIIENQNHQLLYDALIIGLDIDLMLKALDDVTSYYYFTSIIDKRATDVNYFKEFTSKEYTLIDNYKEALDIACRDLKEDEILVITGSLHFISNVIAYFKG